VKRIVLAGLCLLALALLWFVFIKPDSDAPVFRPPRGPAKIPAYDEIHYDFLSPSPFEGGKMWVAVFGGTNHGHVFLYDLDQRKVLGELLNAIPVFMNRDQTRLLCYDRKPVRPLLPEPVSRFLEHVPVSRFLEHVSGGKIHFKADQDREVFWAIELNGKSGSRIGALYEAQRVGSTAPPSPGFRFDFRHPNGVSGNQAFYLFDLEKKAARKIMLDGWAPGWWDDTHVIIKDLTSDFVLYDVLTDKSVPLLALAQITRFLNAHGIRDADPKRAGLFSVWDGRQYDFYLTDSDKRWQGTNSYLVKVERPAATLKLVAANFKFEWSDHLNVASTHYLFSGRIPGDRSTGVFLRDLRDNTTRTLVEPDGGKYFSIPAFYRDGVIYLRDQKLWWVDLNGSNRVCIFPPSAVAR
jgi:hypothetical protein